MGVVCLASGHGSDIIKAQRCVVEIYPADESKFNGSVRLLRSCKRHNHWLLHGVLVWCSKTGVQLELEIYLWIGGGA